MKTGYDNWYNSLPEHTKIWLKSQPVWRDKDMAFAAAIGVCVGWFIGYFM